MTYKIAVVIGSLRKDSWSKKIAYALKELALDSLDLEIVEIGDLAVYNEDLEGREEHHSYQAWTEFREKIKTTDGCIFITPEYNRSIPGGLKNAIDVWSRPSSENVWSEKPAAVMSLSQGILGGFWANHALRQSATVLNMYMMPQPEAFYHSIHNFFTDQNELTQEGHSHLSSFIASYGQWLKKMSS